MLLVRLTALVAVTGASLTAQVPDVKSLSGQYFFREVLVASDTSQASSVSGTLSFDGNGGFAFQGQQLAGNQSPTSSAASGTYTVNSNGSFTMSPDPLRSASVLNGKIGSGALVASNTETSATLFDLLIAIPAAGRGVTNSALNGTYWITTLEFPGGSSASARDSFFSMNANGAGGLGNVSITGEVTGSGFLSQTSSGSTYSLNADGSGSMNFPAPASANAASLVLTGAKNIYAAADGSIFISGGVTAGASGIIIGIKSASQATASSVSGVYFGAGMTVASPVVSAFSGAANATPSNSSIVWSRRLLLSGNAKPLNVSALNNYSIAPQGNGYMLADQLAASSNGNFFLASGVQPFLKTGSFELIFGVKAPALSGTGLFLNPLGVLNSATFALGAPISEGELITVFGSGFATQTTSASKLPLTTTLGGVQVLINGTAAPVFSVTQTQASAIVPYGLSGSAATIVVSSGGKSSNTVTIPVAATSPGIFTYTSDGLGSAAVLHADYSLVSTSSPARRGEVVQVFLTGLGSVSPAVAAGTAAPVNPLSLVTGQVAVFISGLPAPIVYQGLTPGLTALYQLNVIIPSGASAGLVPLAIETGDSFTDQASIAVAP